MLQVQLTFWMNFLALIPLAKILGDATEELDACLHNEVISGLLNATFGNAVEMIITVQTLRVGLLEVVKAIFGGGGGVRPRSCRGSRRQRPRAARIVPGPLP